MIHHRAHERGGVIRVDSILEILCLPVVFKEGSSWLVLGCLWRIRQPMGPERAQIGATMLHGDQLDLIHVVLAERRWREELCMYIINVWLGRALRDGCDC